VTRLRKPVLDEERVIGQRLAELEALGVEDIVVADGGSTDVQARPQEGRGRGPGAPAREPGFPGLPLQARR
jgi:hypothetical protein